MSIKNNLHQNIENIYGEPGKTWLSNLPNIVDELSKHWHLKNISPVNNMTFHYVAKALTKTNQPVVLKIGYDNKVTSEEARALQYFDGNASIKLIDYSKKYKALLLQQAIPGISIKSLYPTQVEFVINHYVDTMQGLHSKPLPTYNNYPHVTEWLNSLDKASREKLPLHLLERAINLKNLLLQTTEVECFLHGDLHHDNILQHESKWLAIDPKGIIGDPAFEIAAFDFIHKTELNTPNVSKLFESRILLIAHRSGLDAQRIKDWVFVRLILSAAWSIEDNCDPSWAINLAGVLFC